MQMSSLRQMADTQMREVWVDVTNRTGRNTDADHQIRRGHNRFWACAVNHIERKAQDARYLPAEERERVKQALKRIPEIYDSIIEAAFNP